MRAARLHHRLLEMKRLQKCQSSSWKACCYGGSLTNNYNASRNTPITIEHLKPVSRSLHSMATLASHTRNPPVFPMSRLFSSSADDMAQKSFEEWNKVSSSSSSSSSQSKTYQIISVLYCILLFDQQRSHLTLPLHLRPFNPMPKMANCKRLMPPSTSSTITSKTKN